VTERIEYMPLSKLVRAPRNPKSHDLGAIHGSVGRFGFVAPFILDDTTGKLVAGHGRLDALQQMKASGKPAPARVQVEGGEWLVPVVRGVSFEDEREAEAYLVADNRTTILGGWDEETLAQVLGDLAAESVLEGTGYDGDDLDGLLAAMNPDWDDAFAGLPEEDRAPFQQMTFTLHDDQAASVKEAMAAAKGLGPFVDSPNENSNGNALARVCELFMGDHGQG